MRLKSQIPRRVKIRSTTKRMRFTYVKNATINSLAQIQKLGGQSLGRGLFLNMKMGQMIAANTYSTTEITRNINTNLSKLKGKHFFSFLRMLVAMIIGRMGKGMIYAITQKMRAGLSL